MKSKDTTLTRYIGAMAMFKIGKTLKRRHNLAEDVRIDMYAALRKWTKGLEGRPFNGGDTPNMADIEMWGMCSAFHGMPTWQDACQNTKIAGMRATPFPKGEGKPCPIGQRSDQLHKFSGWYSRMEDYLGEKSAVGLIPANPTLVAGSEEQKQIAVA
eukprot:sb/3473110/